MRLISGCLCLSMISGCGSKQPTDPASADQSGAVPLSIGSHATHSERGQLTDSAPSIFEPAIQQFVDKARQAVVNGLPRVAIEALSQAISVNPGDARLLRMRADVYVLSRELANARADFSTAIRTDPDNAELYNVRGYFLMMNAIRKEALADFNKAIELKPFYAAAWNNRGLIYLATGSHSMAEQQFRKAVENDENYADGWNNLGFSRFKQGRLDEALVNIQQAIRLNAKYVAAWNNCGLIHMQKEDYEAAEEAFSRAVEFAPMDPRWYNHRRAALLKLERFDEAAQDNRKVLWLAQLSRLTRHARSDLRDPERWIARGDWLAEGDEHGAAIQDYSRALNLQPGSMAALNARARAWAETGDLQQAISDCDESLVIQPSQEAYSIRGDAWLAMNNLDQAIQDYESAQRFDEQIAEAYRLRAASRLKAGDETRAKEDQEAAQRISDAMEGRLSENRPAIPEPVPFPDAK